MLVSINSQAQYCDLASEETNPDIVNSDNNPDNDILDWRTPTYRVKFINQDGSNYEEDIVSPFYTQTLTSVTNPNVIHLDVESRDFEYSDGWELIQWELDSNWVPLVSGYNTRFLFCTTNMKANSVISFILGTNL